MISKNKRQITIYYHSDNSIGKQVFAYTTVSKKKLLVIDILKTKVTGTQWAELASRLDIKIIDLINTELNTTARVLDRPTSKAPPSV